jgi:ribosome-associated translation inhibitor RaiA
VSKRLVPLAAARLKLETNRRIALLGKVEKLAAELREHLDTKSAVDIGADADDETHYYAIELAISDLLELVEKAPLKAEPKAEPKAEDA